METEIKFLKIERDEKIAAFVEKKAAKLAKFYDGAAKAAVTLSDLKEPDGKCVRVTVDAPGQDFLIERKAKSFEDAIDAAIDAMKEKLTRANLRFVVSVAKQYQNQGLSLPDLINEGNLGLIKAAEKFDETRGFKFISYAVWWIRQSILQALAEQSRIVRLPLNQVGSLNKINKALGKFEQENERQPSARNSPR